MNSKKYFANYNSPIGIVHIEAGDSAIISISFAEVALRESDGKHAIITECLKQLDEYFKGDRKKFDLPLNMEGTFFQQQVWNAVSKIDYGKSISYLELAKNLSSMNAVRAVAAANARNKLLLLIPCHRVVGADGAMVGYKGGKDRKQWLLNHEAQNSGFPTLF